MESKKENIDLIFDYVVHNKYPIQDVNKSLYQILFYFCVLHNFKRGVI